MLCSAHVESKSVTLQQHDCHHSSLLQQQQQQRNSSYTA
jgi:hypothetical protein